MTTENQTPAVIASQVESIIAALVAAGADYDEASGDLLQQIGLGDARDAAAYYNEMRARAHRRETLTSGIVSEVVQLAKILRGLRYRMVIDKPMQIVSGANRVAENAEQPTDAR